MERMGFEPTTPWLQSTAWGRILRAHCTQPARGAPLRCAACATRTPANPEIAIHASAGGKAKARRHLTLERVEGELGPLDALEDVNRWLHRIGLWGAAGLLPGVVLGGLVRTCEIKLRVLEHEVTREVVEQLRSRLEELESQVKQRNLAVIP